MEDRNKRLSAVSFLLIASGVILAISSSKIFETILDHILDLTPGKMLYKAWSKPPPPMFLEIFFFNWTNPEDFNDQTKKPIFKEIGPFKFDVRMERTNVTYNKFNSTISYSLRSWFKFNREESSEGLDSEVTLLNQLSAATAYKVKDMNYIWRKSFSMSLHTLTSPLQMTKTVGELLFDGATDEMLQLLRKLPLGVPMPDKFGYFYGKNGSSDGVLNVGTGRGGTKLGMLYFWNGQSNTKCHNVGCNTIRGAAIDFYTGNMNDKVEMFNADLSRKLPLDLTGKSTVHGIEGHKFEIDDSFLDNGNLPDQFIWSFLKTQIVGTIVKGNECFCGNQCVRYGAVPIGACKGKANFYVTLPHFLKADPFYADRVIGMKPDTKKHNFHIVVEPF